MDVERFCVLMDAICIFTVIDDSSSVDNVDHATLSRKEVIKRLRERGEPVLLYGETELAAFKRLRKCEILEPELNKVLPRCLTFLVIMHFPPLLEHHLEPCEHGITQ